MNKLNGSNSAYTFLSYLDEGEDTLKHKRKHRFSIREISPRQKYVFSSAFPNLMRFLSRPVTKFRPFLSDRKTVVVVKRPCGYLGNPQARPMVNGRHKEIAARVKHMNGSTIKIAGHQVTN